MLDIKRIRQESEKVEELLKRRGAYSLKEVLSLDEQRRALLTKVEAMKAQQNKASKAIGAKKAAGEDPAQAFEDLRTLSSEIKKMDEELSGIEAEIKKQLLFIPNTPNEKVVVGKDDTDNVVVRTWGEPTSFSFEPKAHWDLGVALGILDFERAVKISGTRFSMFKGLGARLERSLINFMLYTHTIRGSYTEILPPLMVSRESMTATGQLPKFEEDAFNVRNNDFFMIPTAEVPVTNIHRGEVLSYEDLPVRYAAYTPCFRAEAGSAGRDTRGLIRNHQFDKVELVKLSHPDTSYDELEKLTNDAESILQALEIPYRVVMLSTGDLGFSSAMTYDIEVWLPSYNRYVEISSCSNFEDYQARRGNIRFKDKDGKVKFVHTLNGSGLAVGRTFAALLENYQREDGSVLIPKALVEFFGAQEIKPR